MFEVYCLDMTTGKKFTKVFENPYKARLFINKCNRGNKIWICGYKGDIYQD